MTCLHCGKRLGLLSRFFDQEFCNNSHRKAYYLRRGMEALRKDSQETVAAPEVAASVAAEPVVSAGNVDPAAALEIAPAPPFVPPAATREFARLCCEAYRGRLEPVGITGEHLSMPLASGTGVVPSLRSPDQQEFGLSAGAVAAASLQRFAGGALVTLEGRQEWVSALLAERDSQQASACKAGLPETENRGLPALAEALRPDGALNEELSSADSWGGERNRLALPDATPLVFHASDLSDNLPADAARGELRRRHEEQRARDGAWEESERWMEALDGVPLREHLLRWMVYPPVLGLPWQPAPVFAETLS